MIERCREIDLREKKHKQRKKDELWDCEIQDILAYGTKLRGDTRRRYKKSIPKEILQLTRALVKLDNLIRDKLISKDNDRKAKEEEIEKKKEEIRKLNSVLVECNEHGSLFLKDVIKAGKCRWTGAQLYKCRQCMKELHKDYYKRKKDYVLNKHAQYRANNPERVKEIKSKSWRKCNGRNKDDATIEGESSTSI